MNLVIVRPEFPRNPLVVIKGDACGLSREQTDTLGKIICSCLKIVEGNDSVLANQLPRDVRLVLQDKGEQYVS